MKNINSFYIKQTNGGIRKIQDIEQLQLSFQRRYIEKREYIHK